MCKLIPVYNILLKKSKDAPLCVLPHASFQLFIVHETGLPTVLLTVLKLNTHCPVCFAGLNRMHQEIKLCWIAVRILLHHLCKAMSHEIYFKSTKNS